MKTKLLSPLFLGMFMMLSNSAKAQEYQPLLIQSGFNADVIANGVGPAASSVTHDVDGVSYALISRDYQLTTASTPLTFGLPLSGSFISEVADPQGLSYQLASYSANNSLRLESPSQSGTLTLADPVPAVNLYMLAASGSGSCTVNLSIHFSDNSTQDINGIILSDWYNGNNAAIWGMGRINIDDNMIESGNNPRLYQIPLAIDLANQPKPIQSITVTKVNGVGIANIFAFSGNLYNSCAAPTNITHTSVADNAVLNWSAPASAPSSGYDYYYSTSSAAPLATTTPTGSVPAGVTSVSLNGLVSGTPYYFWVRSDCGSAKGFWQMKQFTAGELTFTYTGGDISTMFSNISPDTATSSSCPGIFTVSVPAGYKIKSTSVSYSMSAFNGAFMSEQRSLLVCQNNGQTESSVSAGAGSSGIYSYNRTGLSIANGLTGDVNYELRAWRLWGGTGCDQAYNKVDNNTFKISVILEPVDALATDNAPKKNNLKVYPNPFTNVLNISEADQVKEVLVSDVSGRLIKKLQKPGKALDFSDLKQGLYIISLKMNDGTVQSFKTVKK